MATQDISRFLFQLKKHYSGARMQKGRVILDSDFNEGEMLDDESQRAIVAEVVGRHGSPDAGFTIGNVATTVAYDFTIAAGTYYLGGMRQEIALSGTPLAPQRFATQSNWQQYRRDDVGKPGLPGAARFDLVYLVGWEQPVSAAEDDELLEQALGGRDAGQRIRRMHRVMVKTGVTVGTCAGAFDELKTALAPFDATTYERGSPATLKVTKSAAPGPDELCELPIASGYVGAENQAIRVQLIESGRFLWGYDNASPLYRVTASVSAGVVTIVFRTPPQEQRFFPLRKQVLEILPWGARVGNGEYVADHPIAEGIGGGVFARVTASYDPSTKTLIASTLQQAKLEDMLEWFGADIPEDERFLYLRVWNPGDDAPGVEQYGIAIGGPADLVPLTGTGLSVTFSAAGVVGDYWIIAARPATPELVVPWELHEPTPPHGPRRFYCPLAIIRWTPGGGGMLATVESCRRTFRPLTRLGDCCSVTVGDGSTSHGEYTSINAAIHALAPDRPGKVCVLPGVYEERVIVERNNLVIEGCGSQSIIRTPAGNATSAGLVSVSRSSDVTLRDLKIEATGQFGVTVLGAPPNEANPSQRIKLENLTVTTRRDATLTPPPIDEMFIPPGSAAFPLCTVGASGVVELSVIGCTLTMVGDLGALANVLLVACWRAVVRDCKILTPPGAGTISTAWGGVHVAGWCLDVLIERNTIHQGLGHGITLGSVHVVPTSGPLATITTAGTGPADPGTTGAVDPGDDCPGVGGGLPYTAGENEEPVPVAPDPGPENVRIRRNRISGMGGSGISVLGFWPEPVAFPVPQIQTHRLLIADNIIEDNYRHPPEGSLSPQLRLVAAFGGIVLADADMLHIHGNVIRGNGRDHLHPVCGIYVLHGENIVIEDNQIDSNGLRIDGDALPGHRAGIALQLVGRLLARVLDEEGAVQLKVDPDQLLPAARVRRNIVIHPAGRALQIYGLGLMSVQGNTLVSEGLAGLSYEELADEAHCVEIQNLGQARELIQRNVIPSNVGIFPDPPLLYDVRQLDLRLLDGRVQFTDNQVRFNPVSGAAREIFCATRLQSYDDIAVTGNQFFVKFPPEGGSMVHDTVVVAWSTRTCLNRWEDPVQTDPDAILTAASAQTLAFINATTLNQASRCIFVDVAAGASTIDNPIDSGNQIYDPFACTAG
ncbi:right-handed parallel beta-helix repeat-containing protein [Nannocystis radixulma]|uniref:Right-handed parallel beta-helix repeat-containing protein n=1 Tax=Nannocystis radixulma TaxID=2995305 RepID=A0ABT5BFG2_9BACT|nr:right-handed parallel beta-helix repeat-containing protein [Nannocystis radixulma]MDC0672881.1 right-handed parallel beta-helix repeat-containing protein [Nannocystis radixulma]